MPSPAISVFLPRPVSAAPLLCPVLLGRHLNLFALLTSQSILGKCRVHHRCGIKQQPWQAASSIGSMSRSVCSCQHCPNGRQPQWATCNSQPQRQHATANHSSNTQQPTTVATSNSQPQWQHATANHSDNKQQPTTAAIRNSQHHRAHCPAEFGASSRLHGAGQDMADRAAGQHSRIHVYDVNKYLAQWQACMSQWRACMSQWQACMSQWQACMSQWRAS